VKAEREGVIAPHCMADDLGREPVAIMGIGSESHPAMVPSAVPPRYCPRLPWHCPVLGPRRSADPVLVLSQTHALRAIYAKAPS
jgi:hypothetical protein